MIRRINDTDHEDHEITLTFFDRDRIVEGRSVTVRDRKRVYVLHVLILETASKRTGKKRRHAIVEIPGGMPIPGRGENSWDLDDDAIYSASFGAATVKEAVLSFMNDVRRTRKRRS